MFGIARNRLAALAAAFSMALAAHALAQSPAASHSHDASAPAKLALDHGKKWATDAPLRDGMTKVRALVEPRIVKVGVPTATAMCLGAEQLPT